MRENKHVGEKKGLRQILWERGLWTEEEEKKEKLTLEGARNRLRACEDFHREQSALGHLLADRGHVLLMSPKAHPEVAGKGIEYSWERRRGNFVDSTTASRSTSTRTCWRRSNTSTSNG